MSGVREMGWLVLGLGLGCAPIREAPAPVAAPVVAPAPVVRPVAAVRRESPAAPAEPGPAPALLEAAHGDGLIVSNKDGLVLLDAGLRPLKVLSRERGRHLRIAEDQLYYFELKQPRLRALDLATGVTRTVVELPRLRNDCFEGGRPADPVAYVQGAARLSVSAGALCMDVADQPGVATETLNYRVDLKTGAVEQRRVAYFSGAVCGEGSGTTAPRLCTPGSERAREASSPSGRWQLTTDLARGEQGEQSYALVLLTEKASGRQNAIVGRKLRPLRPGQDAPVDACMIGEQARAGWLASSDVLLIEGCRDRLSAVLADGRVLLLTVDDFVVVPPAR